MADMSLKVMLDDVNLATLEAHASSADAVAGYVNGSYANWPVLVAKYASSGKHLLSIDVQNKPSAGAQCLDIEKGDAVIGDAPSWAKATAAAGKAASDLRYYPKLYTSESNLVALVAAMTAAGIARGDYMIWSAHYTGKAHICGPKSCGSAVQADATQWTSSYQGVSLDCSQAYGYFFAGPPAATAPATVTGTAAPAATAQPPTGYSGTAAPVVSLQWDGGTPSAAYEYQIATSDGAVVLSATTHSNSVTDIALPKFGSYKWRVKGTSSDYTPWSALEAS